MTRWSDFMYVCEPGYTLCQPGPSPIPDDHDSNRFRKCLTAIAQPLRFQLECALSKPHVRVHVRTCIPNNPKNSQVGDGEGTTPS